MSYNTSLNLAWNANSEPDVAGYKLYAGLAPRVYDGNKTVTINGPVTSGVLTGLDNGQIYYIAVTAFDTSANESTFSAEISKMITVSVLQLIRRVA